jgi:HD-GYP domain-containing protein (c-di-GMP phosphodiesterase class II)
MSIYSPRTKALVAHVLHDPRAIRHYIRLYEHDTYSAEHSIDVAQEAVELAILQGLPSRRIQKAAYAGLLHDAGKIHTPLSILNKTGKYTLEERAIVRAHPADGVRLIYNDFPRDFEMLYAVGTHHEYQRDGYPRAPNGPPRPADAPKRKERKRIGELAEIIAVADTFNALITDRPYRRAFDVPTALQMVREQLYSPRNIVGLLEERIRFIERLPSVSLPLPASLFLERSPLLVNQQGRTLSLFA